MRIDFREERKWKYAVCFEVASAVLEWHAASSQEERIEKGICVLWKRKPVDEREEPERMDVELQEEVDMDANNGDINGDAPTDNADGRATSGDLSEEEDDDDDQDNEQTELMDPLAPTTVVLEALDDAAKATKSNDDKPLEPKTEDIEQSLPPMDVVESDAIQPKLHPDEPAQPTGLKDSSTNPVLGSVETPSRPNPPAGTSKTPGRTKHKSHTDTRIAPMRESIAFADDDMLFLHLEDLSLQPKDGSTAESPTKDAQSSLLPDLDSIFPDLPPLGLLDVAPAVIESKKASKRGQRDDPNKRLEETTFNRITPISQFSGLKPTLLTTLHPAKRWRHGQWISLPEAPLPAEGDVLPVKTDIHANGNISGQHLCSILLTIPQVSSRRQDRRVCTTLLPPFLEHRAKARNASWTTSGPLWKTRS